MSAIQMTVNTFRWLQRFDIQAGRLLGNADHIRAQGYNAFDYAFSLGLRIFLVGLTAALLEVMLFIVVSLNNDTYTALAIGGWSLATYLLAKSIYPNEEMIVFPMVLLLGLVSFVGFAGAIHGLSYQKIFPALSPVFSMVFGALISLNILGVIIKLILKAFDDEPRYPRSLWRQIRRAHLITPAEKQEANILNKRFLAVIVLGLLFALVVLLIVFSKGGSLIQSVVGILCAIGFFVCMARVIPYSKNSEKLEKQIIARLMNEGVLSISYEEKTIRRLRGYRIGDTLFPSTNETVLE